jgi:hypothetical protein
MNKTHFANTAGRFLFCSGRHADFASYSTKLDDVTCKACRRKLIAQARKAA